MANEYTLAASAARTVTAGTNGTSTFIGGFAKRILVALDVTVSATDAGDTLSVYIDVSPDGSKWLNAARFATQAGDGAAKTEFAILDAENPGTATFDATSDCASGVTRPAAWGKYMRARWVVVEAAGVGVASHTFSVKAYTQ